LGAGHYKVNRKLMRYLVAENKTQKAFCFCCGCAVHGSTQARATHRQKFCESGPFILYLVGSNHQGNKEAAPVPIGPPFDGFDQLEIYANIMKVLLDATD